MTNIYIALTTVQYGIYCPGGSFDLRHRWATMVNIAMYIICTVHVYSLINKNYFILRFRTFQNVNLNQLRTILKY